LLAFCLFRLQACLASAELPSFGRYSHVTLPNLAQNFGAPWAGPYHVISLVKQCSVFRSPKDSEKIRVWLSGWCYRRHDDHGLLAMPT